MKNVKMLILSIIAMISVVSGLNSNQSVREAILDAREQWKPFFLGNLKDENGNSPFHIVAQNCDSPLRKQHIEALGFVMTNLSFNRTNDEKLKQLEQLLSENNAGKTPSDIIGEKIQNFDCGMECILVAFTIKELEKAAEESKKRF